MSIMNEIRKRNPKEITLGVIAILLALLGVIGLLLRVFNGDRAADFSSYVPWGLWVAAYIYFSGLSAGAFMIAIGAYVFNVRSLYRVGTLALFTAVLTLPMGLLAIGLDLGHMERAIFVFIRPQFHSMMAWMVWLYTAYLVLVAFMLRYSIAAERATSAEAIATAQRRLRMLGIVGIPLVIAFAGGVGALFGTVIAREYWHTSLYPVFFLIGALTSGAALLTAVVAFLWPTRDAEWHDLIERMRTFVLALVLVEALLEWAEYSVPAWYQVGSAYAIIKFVLFGPYWYVFWLVHLLARSRGTNRVAGSGPTSGGGWNRFSPGCNHVSLRCA